MMDITLKDKNIKVKRNKKHITDEVAYEETTNVLRYKK